MSSDPQSPEPARPASSDVEPELTSEQLARAAGGGAPHPVHDWEEHRDNPTQIPIGTPIALAGIAAAIVKPGHP